MAKRDTTLFVGAIGIRTSKFKGVYREIKPI